MPRVSDGSERLELLGFRLAGGAVDNSQVSGRLRIADLDPDLHGVDAVAPMPEKALFNEGRAADKSEG